LTWIAPALPVARIVEDRLEAHLQIGAKRGGSEVVGMEHGGSAAFGSHPMQGGEAGPVAWLVTVMLGMRRDGAPAGA
jgi:hypothetical protein